ncbi:MAG: acyl-CoA/acyl-ACP dehydrogenase [Candidatus Lokiarchaeota archaeon]|nr:acyl-CoA/acyl-ACP dehydrogenase [Candidatus Lokiarchaeota archaeon]
MYDFMLDEQSVKWKDKAKEFVKKEVPRQLILDMDEDKVQYPTEYVKKLAEYNLLGLRFPKKWGGQGLGWITETAVLEEIGLLPMSLGCLYSLPSICGEALDKFGTDKQKEKYLRPMLEGKISTAEALTEPRGGSDFFGATTTAIKDGDHYILNGQKRFVVGAEGADFFLVYAKTNPNSPPRDSISLFIVERDMGVESKYIYGLLGTRGGGAGRLFMKDVQVPEENLVLAEGKGGLIFYQMMIPERMTSAAGPLGMSRSALEIATKYAHKRKAFGQTIKSFQGVSFRLADSIMLLDASRAMVYQTAKAIDSDQPGSICRRLVSEAKRFSTESATTIISNAMQVLGGIGYTNVFPIERIFRDIRLSTIWTGTSEVMNLIIQHEYFNELLKREENIRDVEMDAKESEAPDEKIYE